MDAIGKDRKVRCTGGVPACEACLRSARHQSLPEVDVVCDYQYLLNPKSTPEAAVVNEKRARKDSAVGGKKKKPKMFRFTKATPKKKVKSDPTWQGETEFKIERNCRTESGANSCVGIERGSCQLPVTLSIDSEDGEEEDDSPAAPDSPLSTILSNYFGVSKSNSPSPPPPDPAVDHRNNTSSSCSVSYDFERRRSSTIHDRRVGTSMRINLPAQQAEFSLSPVDPAGDKSNESEQSIHPVERYLEPLIANMGPTNHLAAIPNHTPILVSDSPRPAFSSVFPLVYQNLQQQYLALDDSVTLGLPLPSPYGGAYLKTPHDFSPSLSSLRTYLD